MDFKREHTLNLGIVFCWAANPHDYFGLMAALLYSNCVLTTHAMMKKGYSVAIQSHPTNVPYKRHLIPALKKQQLSFHCFFLERVNMEYKIIAVKSQPYT